MALTLSDLSSPGICSSWKRLRSLVVLKAERGYKNALDRKMRFNNVSSKMSKFCSCSKHKYAEKLLEVDKYDVPSISDRSKLLTKVSELMGYDGFHDLIKIERDENQFGRNLKDTTDDLDVSLACKSFPSIVLGSSPPVKLYDESNYSEMKSLLAAKGYEELLLNDEVVKWDYPESKELRNQTSSIISKSSEENTHMVKALKEENLNQPLYSCLLASETEEKLDHAVSLDESSTKVRPESHPEFLDRSICSIPGLNNRQRSQLEKCGFHTLRKLLQHFPRTYADMQNAQVGIDDGQYLISVGKVLSSRGIRTNSSFSFLEVVVGCEIADNESQRILDDIGSGVNKTIYLHLMKFFRGARCANYRFLKSLEAKYKLGDVVCVSGKVRTMRSINHYEMREYNIDVLKDDADSSLRAEGKPYPIYPSKGGLTPDFLRSSISRALQSLPADVDPIPKELTQDFGLLRLHDAYIGIHCPENVEEADLARKRLIFDEFFYIQLGRLFQMLEGLGTLMEKDGLLDKYRKPKLNAIYLEDWSSLTKSFLKALPYSLTSSQLSAVSEIIWDLKRPVPMNRLLQGDVGCGKTVVAFLACMEVIGSGYQAAFMVPTELLAIQHYENLLNLLETTDKDKAKLSVSLLTGSTPSKQSRMIRKGLQTGEISMIIGTHSLIYVEFSALRIAVVDEQHRFGVIQRGMFNSKLYYSSDSSRIAAADADESSKSDVYMAPHILALSATPIPRTLALALYGDVSLTHITDLPPGRIPVETYIIEGNHDGFEEIYEMMLEELGAGGRVYVVYPIIEQSEQLPQLRAAATDLETISRRFQSYNCGLLHGKMKSHEKDEALRLFRSGETHILLSTQVIEIGVDVPDASMMVVMNAERFGIAQLHQLRGRVGRGARKSKCILLASTASSLNRLKVLEKSSDGFHLANVDLLLRGPGDLLGKKQSGHLPEFPIARLEIDGNILQEAHAAALKILSDSHDLEQFPALKAELSMRQPLCLLGD